MQLETQSSTAELPTHSSWAHLLQADCRNSAMPGASSSCCFTCSLYCLAWYWAALWRGCRRARAGVGGKVMPAQMLS